MQTDWDLIIIGGGAAGLFLRASLPGKKRVLLLETGPRAGRKLLVTGGGMCNLTNTLAADEFLGHFGSKQQRNFLLPAIQNFPPEATRTWFTAHGLATVARSDGKVFPASMQSSDVLTTLLRANSSPIHYQESVVAVHKEDEYFSITTTNGSYTSRRLALTTGGMSVPQTGSDGSGYRLAEALGHTITALHPALVGITIADHQLAGLSGITIDAQRITLTRIGDTVPYAVSRGAVLITHRGLSGPPILTLSGDMQAGDRIVLTLIADAHQRFKEASGKLGVRTLLTESGLTRSLADALLVQAGIDGHRPMSQIKRADRNRLASLVSSFSMEVSGTGGFATAMVTRGGVALGEVDRKSMQSRRCAGLYFAGEILDYDGESGGYNLQGAFSTAHLAAQSLEKEL